MDSKSKEKNLTAQFWQQWQKHRDSLYRCCLKLMNFNAFNAEDALSQAMLKAWEKIQKYAATITNVKAWLIQLTRNFCIDLIRKRDRSAVGVEDIEWVRMGGKLQTVSGVETPDRVLEEEEKYAEIREAIASLPERLRETFVLHFYEERSHQEIAEIQGISYDNVCKRISLGRKRLKELLSSYFKGEEKKERSPQSVPKKRKKSPPKEKEEKAIPASEQVAEAVAENPQTVIEEESKESEKEEVLEAPREEERSRLSSAPIADALEEKENLEKVEETEETSVLTLTRKQLKKPNPEKLKTSAIAILPPEHIPKEKKRSPLSDVPTMPLEKVANGCDRILSILLTIEIPERIAAIVRAVLHWLYESDKLPEKEKGRSPPLMVCFEQHGFFVVGVNYYMDRYL